MGWCIHVTKLDLCSEMSTSTFDRRVKFNWFRSLNPTRTAGFSGLTGLQKRGDPCWRQEETQDDGRLVTSSRNAGINNEAFKLEVGASVHVTVKQGLFAADAPCSVLVPAQRDNCHQHVVASWQVGAGQVGFVRTKRIQPNINTAKTPSPQQCFPRPVGTKKENEGLDARADRR